MAETYCGKDCLDCSQKDALQCPGCKAGPGKRYGGDCALARCCTDKGHQECSTCGFSKSCGTLRTRYRMPDQRLRSIEAEKIRAAAIAKRAPVLGKWLWLLFWLVIPSTIASIMRNESLAGSIPTVLLAGQVLSGLCAFAYGLILIKLTSQDAHYHTAGICQLVSGAISVLTAFISGESGTPGWMLLISIAAIILFLVGAHSEFTAHSAVLTGLDNELSEKWVFLWKWYMGIYCALFISLLIIFIIPILGLLVVIAATIGTIVVSILKLVYLYQTAQRFRKYPGA